MRRSTLILLIVAVLSGAAAGREAWSKFLWWAGAPGLALPLITDPAAKAAALYETGRYAEANEAFTSVGRSATYNRGLTLAMTGDYALSVAYFDAVLFANRYDRDAAHSREVVNRLVDPVIGEANGHGRIKAILQEAGLNAKTFDPNNPAQELIEKDPLDGVRRLDRKVDNRTVSASEDWLETLADAPGAYLAKRLKAEMKRREELGQAHKVEQDQW